MRSINKSHSQLASRFRSPLASFRSKWNWGMSSPMELGNEFPKQQSRRV